MDITIRFLNDRRQEREHIAKVARGGVRQTEDLAISQRLTGFSLYGIDLRRRITYIDAFVIFLDVMQCDLQTSSGRELHILTKLIEADLANVQLIGTGRLGGQPSLTERVGHDLKPKPRSSFGHEDPGLRNGCAVLISHAGEGYRGRRKG